MEHINVLLAGMKQEEDRLLLQRSRDLQSSATKSKWTVGLLGGMGFFFILTAGLIIQKEIRKRARVEEQFRSILEFAPDFMVIVNQKGQIGLVNSQTEKVFGYSRRELLQQNVEILIPQRFHPQHPGHRTQFFTDPKVRPMGAGLELFALRKDGTEFPVEISLAPLETAEGRLVSCAIRDVTARKQTEEALRRQAQEVERQRGELAHSNVELTAANKEIESFSYSVSHDLRIVLKNLLGNAWKFTSKRQTPRIEFGKTACNGTSAYFVRDDGAGFDSAYASRLFGAFQRLHDKSEFPGTGIGLATVQRIVHRPGCRLWAEGTPDRGATFYFTLAEASR